MAFISCEFSEDMGVDACLSYERLRKSALISNCLLNGSMTNLQNLLDENFLISLVHLVLKTWIKDGKEARKKYPNPFGIFDKILSPNSLRYLELQTIILQSRQLIEQLTVIEDGKEAASDEGEEILSELYSEEIS